MCAKLCFMNYFFHKQLRERGSRTALWARRCSRDVSDLTVLTGCPCDKTANSARMIPAEHNNPFSVMFETDPKGI